jgi:acylphosphatase
MQQQVRLLIQGRVQGVGFRMSACEAATRLGVTGWVRNVPGGSVEALAEGEREGVDRFVAWCRVGPPLARVDDVSIERGDATGEYRGFRSRF